MPPEETEPQSCNVHKEFGKDLTCSSWDMLVDRHTHADIRSSSHGQTHTDTSQYSTAVQGRSNNYQPPKQSVTGLPRGAVYSRDEQLSHHSWCGLELYQQCWLLLQVSTIPLIDYQNKWSINRNDTKWVKMKKITLLNKVLSTPNLPISGRTLSWMPCKLELMQQEVNTSC